MLDGAARLSARLSSEGKDIRHPRRRWQIYDQMAIGLMMDSDGVKQSASVCPNCGRTNPKTARTTTGVDSARRAAGVRAWW